MVNILLLAPDADEHRRFAQELARQEHATVLKDELTTAISVLEEDPPDLVLVNLVVPMFSVAGIRDLLEACSGSSRIPAIALVLEDQLNRQELALGFDDFQLYPVRMSELSARIQQTMRRAGKLPRESEDIIRCGDLMLDTLRYEVYVAGASVELTYKEYELLRFLASNADKVFTREVLLNRVWGYDYYGGARTVDVHIRRLRSKIEDKDHLFIETVRNVGYRFRPSSFEG